MKTKLLFLGLFFSSSVYGETAFDIFADQVHPILANRCAECHGTVQAPMHSVSDTESAYEAARKTINLNFPSSSSLWVRSYNNHCGEKGICGVYDENLLDGIKAWVSKEKDEILVDDFEKLGQVKIHIPELKKDDDGNVVETEKTFAIETPFDEAYEFTVTRLSESVVYFSGGKVGPLGSYGSFDGLELRSSDLQIRTQNFSEYPVVLKPTEEKVDFTSFHGGYLIAVLPESQTSQVEIELFVRGRTSGITRDQAKALYDAGYSLPYVQSVIGPIIKKVYAGSYMNCALTDQGRIKCWGAAYRGQLGSGAGEHIGDQPDELGNNIPYISLGSGEKVRQLATGFYSACALLESNKVKCWGDNDSGQLGNGLDTGFVGDNPGEMGDNIVPVDLGTDEKIIKISGGARHYCVLFETGKIKCWGNTIVGQLGLEIDTAFGIGLIGKDLPYVNLGKGVKAKDIGLGYYSSCALLEKGQVKCWGENELGQLGNGTRFNRGHEEGTMGDNLPVVDLGKTGKVTQLVGGDNHYCVLFDSGKVKCWGNNEHGRLGLGSTRGRGTQVDDMGDNLPHVDLGNHKAVSLSLGERFSCALLDNGRMKCWGDGEFGQLGNGSNQIWGSRFNDMGDNLPYVALKNDKILQFSSSAYSTCALLESNKIKCWGWNGSGELGIGDSYIRGSDKGEMEALPPVDLGKEIRFD